MNSLYDPSALGQTYEAVGPQRLTQVPYFFSREFIWDSVRIQNRDLAFFDIKYYHTQPRHYHTFKWANSAQVRFIEALLNLFFKKTWPSLESRPPRSRIWNRNVLKVRMRDRNKSFRTCDAYFVYLSSYCETTINPATHSTVMIL